MNKSIEELREEIDDLDKELLRILSRRISKVKEIGVIKKLTNTKPADEKRKLEVLQKWKKAAESKNISEDLIENIYKILHDYSLEIEKKQ